MIIKKQKDYDVYKLEQKKAYINMAQEQITPHPHMHNFLEIAYAAQGFGVHIINEKQIAVKKGDLFVINYGIVHEFRSTDMNSPLIIYNCTFSPESIEPSLIKCHDFNQVINLLLFRSLQEKEHLLSSNEIHLSKNEAAEIEDLYKLMLKEYNTSLPGYEEFIRSCIIQLLIRIFRLSTNLNELNNANLIRNKIIDRTIEYIKKNYFKNIKTDDVAYHAFLSRNHFCSIFKKHTGMTVNEYIRRIRIDEACSILLATDKKVTEVAYEVGYKDIKYFNSVFKDITGCTPSEYKKKAASKNTPLKMQD